MFTHSPLADTETSESRPGIKDVCQPSTMFIDDCFTVDSNHWLTHVNKILDSIKSGIIMVYNRLGFQ